VLSWSVLRRMLVVVAVVAVVVPWPGAQPAGAASRNRLSVSALSSAGPLTAPDAAGAAALAAWSGQPVEVLGQRTDWAQTFAEPGGGFLFQESAVPFQVQQVDGSWVPIDTTLAVQPGGVVAPGATTVGLTLSDGGSGPLFTLSQGGQSVSVSSPFGALPVPSLSGPTAIYAGVLPGVNLLMSATPTGVRSVLQVMSAAAAANPALAKITFPVSVSGVSLAADGQGGVVAADPSGTAVFSAPPIQMWDSAGAAVSDQAPTGSSGSAAAQAGPQPGDHLAVAGVSVTSGSVTVSPAASLLGGAQVTYPVYVDPDFNKSGHTSWLDVAHDFSGGVNGGPCSPPKGNGSWGCWGDWQYTDPAGGIRAGAFCETPPTSGNCNDPNPDSTWGVYRSYLNFEVPSGLAGADYVDARLNLNEVYSWSCNASTLELWQTAEATQVPVQDWHNRPSEENWQDSLTTAHGWSGTSGNCPVRGITLNATSALGNVAASGASHVTLEVRASLSAEQSSPPVVNSWKKFQATAPSDPCANGAPCLSVFWLHNPDRAQATGTEGTFNALTGQVVTDCATQQGSPDYVGINNEYWDASDTDSQTGVTIQGHFSWTNLTAGNSGTIPALSPDSPFQGQRIGSEDAEYKWQAYGEVTAQDPLSQQQVTADGLLSSPPCYFAIDADTSPGSGPQGVVHVDGQVSPQVGKPGTFTFTDPAYSQASDSDVAGYAWSVGSSQPTNYVPATNGTAAITLKPFTTHQLNLYVQAVDVAGNRGPLKTSGSTTVPSFVIEAATTLTNISTLADWRLNGHGTDVSGFGNDVTLSGASYQCGSQQNTPGYTCSLNGAEDDTSGGVVSPEAGFTVSAWVQMSGCTGYCVAMSEDATTVAAFALGWAAAGQTVGTYTCPSTASHGCWVFAMRKGDDPTLTQQTAGVTVTSGQAGAWVQLTGVFDQVGTATLYVDGANPVVAGGLGRWTPCSGPAPCINQLRLGAGYNGSHPWQGNVSASCVFYGPLSDQIFPPQTQSDIQALWAGGTADGCAAVSTEYLNP
jgi:Concanavalin A-like lectin/glucanases superfamily